MQQETFELGRIATAIGASRGTLLSWAQRGYLPFLDERREVGNRRQFDLDGATYTAAFAAVASFSDARMAQRAIDTAIQNQPQMWKKYVQAAISKGQEFYVLIKSYTLNGIAELEAELCNQGALESELDAFKNNPVIGGRHGDAESDLRTPPVHVSAIALGSAIQKTFRILSAE